MNNQGIQDLNVKDDSRTNKNLIIILSLLLFLIVTLIITIIIVNISKNNSNSSISTTNTSANVHTAFEDLTKEEAISFLQSQDVTTGILPENYVNKEITNSIIMNGNTIVSDLVLIYSYDTLEDLKEQVREKYKGLNFLDGKKTEDSTTDDNFNIKEYDYYAIVTPNRIKEETTTCDHGYNSDCDSLLSFKRNYLDYYLEETKTESGSTSISKVAYAKTQDPKILSCLLRVFTMLNVGLGGHGNIYSYNFEEQDDKYVLINNYVGAGINLEYLNNPSLAQGYTDSSDLLAINLYRRHITVDKTDGKISLAKNENNNSTMYDYKSFPITQEEFNSLPGYGNN